MTLNDYYNTITYDDYLQHALFSNTSLGTKINNFKTSVKNNGLRNTLSSYGRNLASRAKSDIKSGAKYMKEEFVPKYIDKVIGPNGKVKYIYDELKNGGIQSRFKKGFETGNKTSTSRAHNLGAFAGSIFNRNQQEKYQKQQRALKAAAIAEEQERKRRLEKEKADREVAYKKKQDEVAKKYNPNTLQGKINSIIDRDNYLSYNNGIRAQNNASARQNSEAWKNQTNKMTKQFYMDKALKEARARDAERAETQRKLEKNRKKYYSKPQTIPFPSLG